MVVIVLVSVEVLVVVLSSIAEVWSSVHIWVMHISNPVSWMVLNTVHVVVVRHVSWVVLSLIQVAVVGTVVAINTSVNIVVVTVILTGEVTLVSQMWLVSLQVPESSIEVGEIVAVFSVDWGSVVWVLVRLVLKWGQIVVWDVPGSVEVQVSISVVCGNWVVSWSEVSIMEDWSIGVVVSVCAVGVMHWDSIVVVSVHVTKVIVFSVLLLGILGCSLLWLFVFHEHGSVGSLVLHWLIDVWSVWVLVWHPSVTVVSVWGVSRVVPWVSVAHSSVLWVSSIAVWESTVAHTSIWSLSVSKVVQFLTGVRDGLWVSELVVGISGVETDILMLVALLDLATSLVLVGWLSLNWENVGWVPHISVSVSVSVWFHLEDEVSIEHI